MERSQVPWSWVTPGTTLIASHVHDAAAQELPPSSLYCSPTSSLRKPKVSTMRIVTATGSFQASCSPAELCSVQGGRSPVSTGPTRAGSSGSWPRCSRALA